MGPICGVVGPRSTEWNDWPYYSDPHPSIQSCTDPDKLTSNTGTFQKDPHPEWPCCRGQTLVLSYSKAYKSERLTQNHVDAQSLQNLPLALSWPRLGHAGCGIQPDSWAGWTDRHTWPPICFGATCFHWTWISLSPVGEVSGVRWEDSDHCYGSWKGTGLKSRVNRALKVPWDSKKWKLTNYWLFLLSDFSLI